jgi:NAD(P)-dependent dehydrogenase (short-subunit alcohol dehydrogenase family)
MVSRPVEYTGKTAVVTGAASGIGRALAVELARRGANLAISDVNHGALDETVDLCGNGTGKVLPFVLDVADRGAVLAHAEEVIGTFGTVNLVFNNAGVAVAATVEEMSFDDLDWLLGINLMGVLNGTKAFLPHLISSGDGHLVNISSVFGLIAPAYQSAYSTAKFGVRGFTESLRQEMLISGQPVTVHSVHPGGIKTNIARSARYSGTPERLGADPARQFDRVARTTPAKAAETILAGIDRNRGRILIGADAYVLAAIPRILGARYVGLFGRFGRRMIGP